MNGLVGRCLGPIMTRSKRSPGKRGIGLGVKRARSPTSAERVAKMAKMAADDAGHRDFRDRAKHEYEVRRAEGRLGISIFFFDHYNRYQRSSSRATYMRESG